MGRLHARILLWATILVGVGLALLFALLQSR